MKNTDAATGTTPLDGTAEAQDHAGSGSTLDVGFRYSEGVRGALEQQGVNVARREGLVTVGRVFAGGAVLTPVVALLGNRAEAKARTHTKTPRKPTADPVAANVLPAEPVHVKTLSEVAHFITREELKNHADPAREYITYRQRFSAPLGASAGCSVFRTNPGAQAESAIIVVPENINPDVGEKAVYTRYIHSFDIYMRRGPNEDWKPVAGELVKGTNGNYGVRIKASRAEMEGMKIGLDITATYSFPNPAKTPEKQSHPSVASQFKWEHQDFLKGTGQWGVKFPTQAARDKFVSLAERMDLLVDRGSFVGVPQDQKVIRLLQKAAENTHYSDNYDKDINDILQSKVANCNGYKWMVKALCALNNIGFCDQTGLRGGGVGQFAVGEHGWACAYDEMRGPVPADLTLWSKAQDPAALVNYLTLNGDQTDFTLDGQKVAAGAPSFPVLVCVPKSTQTPRYLQGVECQGIYERLETY